jgi:hypothetical protein
MADLTVELFRGEAVDGGVAEVADPLEGVGQQLDSGHLTGVPVKLGS